MSYRYDRDRSSYNPNDRYYRDSRQGGRYGRSGYYGQGDSSLRYQSGASRGSGQNLGSARSDYGERAYGGRLDDRGFERGARGGEERGFFERAGDEVASWFGDEEAERRRRRDEARDERDERRFGANRGPDYDRGAWETRTTRDRAAWRGAAGARPVSSRPFDAMRAHEVMTRDVATVHPNEPVSHAARLMRDEDCGALPVVDEYGRAVGMVTDRDIVCRLAAEDLDLRRARVEDCMTSDLYACDVDASLEECMRQMARHQIRRLPIVDDRDRVVGIVSQADLARRAEGARGGEEKRRVGHVLREISEPTSEPYR